MSSYTVANKSEHPIWWRDGLWTSGRVPPGDVRTFDSDHDANVTMYGVIKDEDVEYGYVWIHRGTKLTVFGNKRWCLE